MRTILFYIPHTVSILGIERNVFGFGWMLFLWAVVSGLLLAWLFWKKRSKEAMGLLPVLGLLGLAIALVVPMLEEVNPLTAEPIGLAIRGYGVMMLLGVVCAVGLAAYRARQMGLEPEMIFSLAFFVILSGVVGARLWYVVQYWNKGVAVFQSGQLDFGRTLQRVVNVTEGGLVVYGGLIGGLFAGLIYLNRRKLPKLAICDLVAPSFAFSLVLGRIGCFLNGCCYGGVCEPPQQFASLAVTFPAAQKSVKYPVSPVDSPPYAHQHATGQLYGFRLGRDDQSRPIVVDVDRRLAAGLKVGDVITSVNDVELATPAPNNRIKQTPYEKATYLLQKSGAMIKLQTEDGRIIRVDIGEMPSRSRPVHPTQLYSAINGFLLGALMWFYYPFRRRDGEVLAVLLTVYPVARFLLEFIRTDESGQFGTALTVSQWCSLFVFVGGIALWVYLRSRPAHVAFPVQPAEA